ncbi:MAG: glyceraldehyde 3-phosphate dehydrogenase NAD-binding domain-containing protein, partial [Gammaproteobacteria bacterium]
MAMTIGINGFGRMGRLGMRAGWDMPEFDVVRIN